MKYDFVSLKYLLLGVLFGVLLNVLNYYYYNQPKPLQNVVCDTSYGVQYFEHKGILTLRVNHEGIPIRCFE